MKLIRGVLQGFAVGLSPCRLGCRFVRGLSTINPSGFGASGSANSFEPADEFERRIFSDLGNSRGSDSFYQKLDRLGKANDRSGSGSGSIFNDGSRYGLLDDINETLTTLSDGMDGKLKEAASYFEYDLEEVSQDDYKYRPDVTFHTGNTYDIKDLDLTKPGIRKPAKRNEFEVTTEEVLRRADFRNVRFLANFITDAGVIIKRSQTKISAKAQRKVAREIKTARAFGLMPFTTMGTKHFVFGKTMQDLDEDYEYETYDTHNFVDTEAF